jgi:hypothetical protein
LLGLLSFPDISLFALAKTSSSAPVPSFLQQYMPLEQNKEADTSMGIPDDGDHEFA